MLEFLTYPRTLDALGIGIVGIFFMKSIPLAALDEIAIIPNVFLWLIEFTSLVFLSWLKGPRSIDTKTILLSLLPPIFFIIIARNWIKEQKEAGNPYELYIGVYLLIAISFVFLILSMLIIGLSLMFSPDPSQIVFRLIYLILLGPMAMIGWWIGGAFQKPPPQKATRAKIVGALIPIWITLMALPIEFSPVYI